MKRSPVVLALFLSLVSTFSFSVNTSCSNESIKHEVFFDSQGGSAVSTVHITEGQKLKEPAEPSKDGYAFSGWYKEESCENLWNFNTDTVESDLTLYAKWLVAYLVGSDDRIYVVSFDSQGGTNVDLLDPVESGGKIPEPVSPTKSNHVFIGWYRESSGLNQWSFTTDMVSENMTLYAKWEPPCSVIFDSLGGSAVSSIENITPGDIITEPKAPTKISGVFEGWYRDSTYTHKWNFSTDIVTSDMTLYANWEYGDSVPQYLVSFDSRGGSEIENIEIQYKDKIPEPVDPLRGAYSFEGWYKDPDCLNKWDFDMDIVVREMTLYAKWITPCLVSFDSRGGSGIQAIETQYQAKIPKPIDPLTYDPLYVFAGWYKETACLNAWDFDVDTADKNLTLYAKWFGPITVGGRGPAGGYIFYDKGSYSDGWRYMEAAPTTISGRSHPVFGTFGYYRSPFTGPNQVVGTGTAIGTGKANTAALVAAMGESAYIATWDDLATPNYAAKICADYSLTVGATDYDDWFLPSKDELNLVYQNLKVIGLGGDWGDSEGSFFWSSSEQNWGGHDDSENAWNQYFFDGWQSTEFRSSVGHMKPIRAF